MEFIVKPSALEAKEYAARLLCDRVKSNPAIVLGLATGRTMEDVYAQIVAISLRESISFRAVKTFNLDEYIGTPPDDTRSFAYFMRQHLFNKVEIPEEQRFFLNGTARDPLAEAARFEQSIIDVGGIDVQLLGIGTNGHIAFNEPGSSFDSRTREVDLTKNTLTDNFSALADDNNTPQRALTMGIANIMECRSIILVATGQEKSQIVATALHGPITPSIPASILQTHPNCLVVLDQAAATRAIS